MVKKILAVYGVLSAQLTIAALYSWSILGIALEAERGWSGNSVLMAYSIAQFVFAFSTIFSGKLIDLRGPRLTMILGGTLYGGGLLLSSRTGSPIELYLYYGLLSGAGVGFVYVCPLSTLIRWFPDHKGAITGLSVSVFGGGSILFKKILTLFLQNRDVSSVFLMLGLMSLSIILLGALMVSLPEGEYKKVYPTQKEKEQNIPITSSPEFYCIWLMYCFAVIPGLLVLGAAKNIGFEVGGLSDSAAASIITVLALSNAVSRLVSGSLSDRFGPMKVITCNFLITLVSLLLLSFFSDFRISFYVGLIGVAVGYGGFLTLFPVLTYRRFGAEHYGRNYGLIFQAYGIAALTGILIKSVSGSFINTFLISTAAIFLGLMLVIIQHSGIKKTGRSRQSYDHA